MVDHTTRSAGTRRALIWPDGRIPFLDWLRGLAPLLVIWSHLAGFLLFTEHREWSVHVDVVRYVTGPLHLYQDAGHLGVILFFLVSGFVVTHASRRESVPVFTLKRVLRIMPMLWVAVLVTLAARSVADALGVSAPAGTAGSTFGDYLRGAFLLDSLTNRLPVNGVTWTLVIEVFFYLLAGVTLAATRRRPAQISMVILGIWLLITVGARNVQQVLFLRYFLPYVGFLLLGRAFYLARTRIIGTWSSITLITATMAATLAAYLIAQPDLLRDPNGPLVTYGIAIGLFVGLMLSNPSYVPTAVTWLADRSYALYLLHLPVGLLVIVEAQARGMSFSAAFVLGVLASFAAASLAHRVVEKPIAAISRRAVGALLGRERHHLATGRGTRDAQSPWLPVMSAPPPGRTAP